MKLLKLTIFFCLNIFIYSNVLAQMPYYDALTLSNPNYADGEFLRPQKEVLEIAKLYIKDTNDHNSLIRKFNLNPFVDINDSDLQSGLKLGDLSSTVSSIGGLNVTNIADGLAKFLVERTKQELSIAFFEKFKEELEKPEYRDLQTLFPETYKVLLVIDIDIYSFEPPLSSTGARSWSGACARNAEARHRLTKL